jgi:hypothetical protein
VAAGQRQGAAGELTGATGSAPGKAVGGGAHSSGGARSGGGGCLRQRHSLAGRELWWPMEMEARPYSVGAEEGR